jgi:hypothetical protein
LTAPLGLVTGTDLPGKDIARRVGYISGRCCARAFEGVHSLGPAAFRARHANRWLPRTPGHHFQTAGDRGGSILDA